MPGSANELYEKWVNVAHETLRNNDFGKYKKDMMNIVKEFDELPLLDIKKPRVGVVGEILVKYHPNANNDVVNIIESEGGEAVVLDLTDFLLYGMYSKEYNHKYLSG